MASEERRTWLFPLPVTQQEIPLSLPLLFDIETGCSCDVCFLLFLFFSFFFAVCAAVDQLWLITVGQTEGVFILFSLKQTPGHQVCSYIKKSVYCFIDIYIDM